MSRTALPATLLLFSLAACSAAPDQGGPGADESSSEDTSPGTDVAATTACNNPAVHMATDPDYRVEVYATVDNGGSHPLPSASSSWTLRYEFVVPPLPCSSTWNNEDGNYYIWGDVDFDIYGANGQYPLSSYVYNQIVPQLMVGQSLSGNDSAYKPSWKSFPTWVIQPQYFWQNQDGNFYAKTGSIKNVNPGDVVTTKIQYSASTGSITAHISTPNVSTSMTIPRPFLNESPAPFSSWKDFFEKAQAKSKTLYGRPQMNVESHYVDPKTMCSVLPWKIDLFSIPGVTANGSNFTAVPVPNGGFTCSQRYAKFNF